MTAHNYNLVSQIFRIIIIYSFIFSISFLSIQPASSSPGVTVTYNVDLTDDIIINSGCDDGVADADCSLRGAISLITAFSPNEYVINIPDGVYTLDIVESPASENANTQGDLDINMAVVTLQGQSMTGTIIDGHNTDRILDLVGTSNTYTLNDLTLLNGLVLKGEGGGGGIRINGGNLILNQVAITNNTVEGIYEGCPGACVYADTGGGIYETGAASLTITSSTISHNFAVWGGGIDHQDNTSLSLVDSSVTSNKAIRNGGGLLLRSGTNTIERSMISENTGEVGGGISNFPGTTLSINNSTIEDNTSTTSGGGVETWGSTTLTNVTINHNYAAYSGGGLSIWGAMGYGTTLVIITNVTLVDNSTPGGGGGLYVGYQGSATLDHVSMAGNTASGGGHAIQAHYGSMSVTSTIISSSSSGSTCGFDNGGSLISNNYNLSSDASCNLGVGDLVNQDMQFGTFGDHFGFTDTLPILKDSPAINFGNPADPANRLDQRSVPILGGRSDSGAFEFIPPSLWLPVIVRPMTY
jgi:hypothetical protein